MNGINATPGSPVAPSFSDQMAVGSEPLALRKGEHATLEQIAAQLPKSTEAHTSLAAPAPDAVTPATAKKLQQSVGIFGAAEVAFDAALVNEVMARSQVESRNSSRLSMKAAEQANINLKMGISEKIREAAQDTYEGAISQAAVSIATGAASAGLSAASAAQTVKAANLEAAGQTQLNLAEQGSKNGMATAEQTAIHTEGLTAVKDAKILGASAAQYQSNSQAIGGIGAGMGGLFSASPNLKAAQAKADQTDLETKSAILQAAIGDRVDDMKTQEDTRVKILDTAQKSQEARAASNRSMRNNF